MVYRLRAILIHFGFLALHRLQRLEQIGHVLVNGRPLGALLRGDAHGVGRLTRINHALDGRRRHNGFDQANYIAGLQQRDGL